MSILIPDSARREVARRVWISILPPPQLPPVPLPSSPSVSSGAISSLSPRLHMGSPCTRESGAGGRRECVSLCRNCTEGRTGSEPDCSIEEKCTGRHDQRATFDEDKLFEKEHALYLEYKKEI
mmetsp:Transcript_43250/g.84996  ORF Transcript_43250/g.84996 Transcript_43250/m.84996 type:complete len:123 (-) Transcript_43250:657-1025(-)